jgi:hypothetical protein
MFRVSLGLFSFLLLVALMTFSEHAVARTKPVYNIVDKPVVTGSGRSLTQEEVGQILAEAAEFKRWTVEMVEEGYLRAQIQVRKHFAAIDIRYTATSYSITYRDSKQLKYDGKEIHRNYNKWIMLIDQVADQKLSSL